MKDAQRNMHSLYRGTLAAVFCGLVVLFVCVAIFLLYRYTTEQVYQESVNQLNEISKQLFEKLDVQIENQWGYLEKLNAKLSQSETITGQELVTYIAQFEKGLAPINKQIKFRVITDDGHFYTDEGRQGVWTWLDEINGSPRQSFLISNWLEDEVYMAFVISMPQTVTIEGHRIEYLVLLRSMTDMQPFFHSSAFSDKNVAYIVNKDGFVLSADGSLEGIDFEGKNAFRKMEEQIFPHVDSFSAVLDKGKLSELVCTDVIIKEQKYYLVYNRIANYDWAILLLISSQDVAVSAAQMVSSIYKVFTTFLCMILLLLVVGTLFLSRIQRDRKIINVQENARKKLETAQKETEKALEIAKKATVAKSQFLSNMSHDIRTPMNAIMGVTSLMEHEVENPEMLRYYIQKLRQSGSYMLGLINDVLDMSKIEAGDVHLNLAPLKLAEQVGQVESIIRSQCNEKGQEFTVSVREISHEYLIGDSIRCRQIFLNLLTNAVKYTPSGGSIRFEIEERPCALADHATIFTSVIDNGHGMKADFLEHLFEPFTREVNSVTNKIQGTGLGMSITKSLVDLMGGSITVQSEPEKGSRFDVLLTLPIDKTVEYPTTVRSMVLISSEEMLVNNIKAALKETSVALSVVPSLEEAVSLVKEKVVEAVVLSGYTEVEKLTEAVERLRQVAIDPVLIFCCDYEHPESMRKTLAGSGVDGVIARPFFFENLVIAIHSALEEEAIVKHGLQYSALNGKRFLCAEDNSLNAEILEALLSMHNASCTICSNGEELVKTFANVKPGDYDAILMDVQMPKMNGLEATRVIRKGENPLGRIIPIVAMTANAFSSDVEECYKAGMDAHLAKPLDMTTMERTIQLLLDEKQGGGGRLYGEFDKKEKGGSV